MKIKKIPVKEFYKIAEFTPGGYVSTSSIDTWLKVKTDQEFTVVEKAFLQDAVDHLQSCSTTVQNIHKEFKEKWGFNIAIL